MAADTGEPEVPRPASSARESPGRESPDEAERVLAEYREKGLAEELGFGMRPAVLVIDLIRGFTDPDSPLGSDLDREVEATARLLAAARRAGRPIVFTTTAYDESMLEAGIFVRKVPSLAVLQRGSAWVELDPRLGFREGEVLLEKQYASAFFGTPLASVLTTAAVDTLLVAGATTSGCVRASVVDALQLGFRPMVVRECVGDRAERPHVANLLDIQGKYGDVVELERALAYLDEGAE